MPATIGSPHSLTQTLKTNIVNVPLMINYNDINVSNINCSPTTLSTVPAIDNPQPTLKHLNQQTNNNLPLALKLFLSANQLNIHQHLFTVATGLYLTCQHEDLPDKLLILNKTGNSKHKLNHVHHQFINEHECQ